MISIMCFSIKKKFSHVCTYITVCIILLQTLAPYIVYADEFPSTFLPIVEEQVFVDQEILLNDDVLVDDTSWVENVSIDNNWILSGNNIDLWNMSVVPTGDTTISLWWLFWEDNNQINNNTWFLEDSFSNDIVNPIVITENGIPPTVIKPMQNIVFDDTWRIDPVTIFSVTTSWGLDGITYCSLISRLNIENILSAWGSKDWSIQVAQGDAYDLIQQWLEYWTLIQVDNKTIWNFLNDSLQFKKSTVFDMYIKREFYDKDMIHRWHRLTVFVGTDDNRYVLDPLHGDKSNRAQRLDQYIVWFDHNSTLYMRSQWYNPIITEETIALQTGVVLQSWLLTVTIPAQEFVMYDQWRDSEFSSINDFFIGDVSISLENLNQDNFSEQIQQQIWKNIITEEQNLRENVVENIWELFSEDNNITQDIELINHDSSYTIDNTTLNIDPWFSPILEFVIWDPDSHLQFTKAIQVEIHVPDISDGTKLEILVHHEWDTEFGSRGLTTNPNATCNEGFSSDDNNIVTVSDGMMRFYTCGASTFIITPTIGSATITTPFSGSIYNTWTFLFAGTGSNNGSTVTLTLSGWGVYGTAIVENNMWFIQPTMALEVGNHEICVNTGNCITVTIVNPSIMNNIIDTSFISNSVGAILTIIPQSEGKYIIWWSFTGYNGVSANRIARITSTGAIDPTFTWAGANDIVRIALSQSDGKYMVWWEFTGYNGISANRIARVTSTGAIDSTFTWARANGPIYSILQQPDSKYMIWWEFTGYNGVSANNIVRVTSTGAIDTTFTWAGANDMIRTVIQQPDGKYMLWGRFTTYNGVSANRIVRVTSTGAIDPTFTWAGANNLIRTVLLQSDGKYMIWWDFTTYNGVSANRIVRVTSTGAIDSTFTWGGANNFIQTIILQPDGKYMIWWNFTNFNSVSANRILSITSTGAVDPTFTWARANNIVRTVVQQPDGKYVIWWNFTTYNGVSANGIVRIWVDSTAPIVNLIGSGTVSIEQWGIYTESWASWTDNVDGSWNVFGWVYNSTWSFQISGSVNTSAIWVYTLEYRKVDNAGNVANIVTRVVRVVSIINNVIDTSFISNSDGAILTIIPQSDGKYIIWWSFTGYNGISANRIVRVTSTGATDSTFTWTGTNNTIRTAISQSDGKYMIWWEFTTYNGVSANRIARITSTGFIDLTFTWNRANGPIYSILQQPDEKYVIWWDFTTYNGVSANRIVRVTSTGATDSTFTWARANGLVRKILQQSDGKYMIWWNFTTYNGVSANRIARITSTGAIDPTFTWAGANNIVRTVVQQLDGKYMIWWDFTTYNGVSANRIVRVTSTGAIDPTFTWAGANNFIQTIIEQSDEKYVIWWDFTTYNGVSANRIARITSTGAIDPTFTWAGANNIVRTVVQQSDGKYMIWWNFTTYNGVSANRIVRLWGDVTSPIVSLIGSGMVSIEQWGIYTESWASWTDNVDGSWNIFGWVYNSIWSFQISGSVNTSAIWVYTLEYRKVDNAWNVGNTVTRVVNILPVIRSSQWGGAWGSRLFKDSCPDWDDSDSYYDRTCDSQSPVQIDKFLPSKAMSLIEQSKSYQRALSKGMIATNTLPQTRLDTNITRAQLAKMFSIYSTNVLWRKVIKSDKKCDFLDINQTNKEFISYIKNVCQLEIMGLQADGKTPLTYFNPNSLVTRAEFGTVLSRVLYGNIYDNNNTTLWRELHLNNLKKENIITVITPFLQEEIWLVMPILYRNK